MRPLDEFRSYLRVLAQAQLSRQFRRHLDASDIVQQTLLEAHKDEDNFQGDTEPAQMAWLRRILARNLLDEIKRLRRKRRDIGRERPMQEMLEASSMRLADLLAADQSTPSGHIGRDEDLLRLANALTELTDDQQQAVVQRHLEGRPLVEIAESMERSTNAVAALIHRGLVDLRGRLAR